MIDTRLVDAVADAAVALTDSELLRSFNDAGVLGPGDVYAAAALARRARVADDRVILAAALTLRGVRYGHVAITLANHADTIVVEGGDEEAIDRLPWPDTEPWLAAVESSAIVGPPGSARPLILANGLLYLHRYHRYEEMLSALVRDRIVASLRELPAELAGQVDDLLAPDGGTADDLQSRAAHVALGGRLAVIAGGPGTGKTFVIARMLQALARSSGEPFPRIAVCAPTGKAAARLGEEIASVAADERDEVAARRLESIDASTIHRLLGSHPARSRFRHDGRNPLPHDMVIVDEMSMVSLPLAAKLLGALKADAAVVLVGDPNQLESIEAGTVLADLVGAAGSAPAGGPVGPMSGRVVVLERVHRFAETGAIGEFAAAVRAGDPDRASALLAAGGRGLTWITPDAVDDVRALVERVLEQRSSVVAAASAPGGEGQALDRLDQLAVLSAHRRGPDSVEAWRRSIEAGLLRRFPDLAREGEWYPGRPIMITRNDPNLGLFNGDIGVTAMTDDGMRAVFRRDRIVTVPRSNLGEHEAVHALTIHKSQGSQFEEVIVSLPGQASRLLTRELLYTAVTRARSSVTIIGDQDVVRRAVQRKVRRASGLADRLGGGTG